MDKPTGSLLKRIVLMTVDGIRKRRWETGLVLLILLISLSLTGILACATGPIYPAGVKEEVRMNRLRMSRFLELMKEGKTTPEQNAKMLEANFKAWRDLETAMHRGDKEGE